MVDRRKAWTIKTGNPQSLGITRYPQGVNFALEVKKGAKAELVLVSKENGEESVLSLENSKRIGDVLAFRLEDLDCDKYSYYYRINDKKVLDPYACEIVSNHRRVFGLWNTVSVYEDEKKCQLNKQESEMRFTCGFGGNEFDWQEDIYPQIPLNEVILYCGHLRGFTKHSSSKVKYKGTFQGFKEKIPYLKEMGINQIELMPVYEFKEVIEEEDMLHLQYREEENKASVNYWGYSDENYYYAVKQTYAASEDAATELKTLVRELHKSGIELILEFYFAKDCPVSFVCQCLKYWVMEYHVDGFHITGEWNGVLELLKEPLLADKKIYSAAWSMDHIQQTMVRDYDETMPKEFCVGRQAEDTRRAAICAVDYLTNMRSFLKGDSGKVMDAAYYMRRNNAGAGVINFFTFHDGFTMMDMVSYDQKHNEANEEGNQDGWDYNYSWNCGVEGKTKKKKILDLRKRQMKNAWVMLLLSQGIPAILAGDERCNSQNGNNNVYCQDNEIGWLNWRIPKAYEELYTFVRQLIQLRKEHPIIHLQSEPTMTDTLENGYPDLSYHSDQVWYMDPYRTGHALGMLYCGDYAQKEESDDYFYIANNMGWNKQKFAIPNLPKNRVWYRLIDTDREESIVADSTEETQRVIEVPARTIVVLIGKKIKVKDKNARKTRKKPE